MHFYEPPCCSAYHFVVWEVDVLFNVTPVLCLLFAHSALRLNILLVAMGKDLINLF